MSSILTSITHPIQSALSKHPPLAIIFCLVLIATLLSHFVHPLSFSQALPAFIVLALLSHHQSARWLCLFVALYTWTSANITAPPSFNANTRCQATLTVTSFPVRATPTGVHFRAQVNDPQTCPLQTTNQVHLRLYDHQSSLSFNTTFRANLTLSPATASEYGKYGSHANATIEQFSPHTTSQGSLLNTWRASLSKLIDTRHTAATAKWLQALLLGNRSTLSPNDWLRLKHTGTTHLLAISGLHLGLIIGTLFIVLQTLFAHSQRLSAHFEPRSLALIAALIFGAVYALITGAQPPVLRAYFMFAVFALHWFYAPLRNGIQALLITAILLLLHNAYLIFSIGAWLSFCATATIIFAYQRYAHQPPLLLWFKLQLLVTLSLLPIVWAVFGGFSLISWIVNLIVIPWLGIVLILSYLSLLHPKLSSLGDYALNHYLNIINHFADSNWHYLSPNWQPTLALAFILSLSCLLWLNNHNRLSIYSLITALILIIYQQVSPKDGIILLQDNPPLAIIHQQGHTYLINAGYRHKNSGYDQAQRQILPALKQRGLIPSAIIFTTDSKRATTATRTLSKHYPNLALYSVTPILNLPLDIHYCPPQTQAPLTFNKNNRCQANISQQWQITHQGILRAKTAVAIPKHGL